jgi:signal transduction histidine kinase
MHADSVISAKKDNAGAASGGAADGRQEFEDFIYLISHDVRASVRALLELPQWIAEDLETAGIKVEGQVAQSINLMNRHTGRLDRMLVDLLTYSRIGRMQATTSVDLDAALAQVLDAAKVPPGFEVVQSLEWPALTIGEHDVLTLLSALISNGIKHHDKATGRLIVTSRRDGAQVVLAVSDDGPGIEEAFADRVFGAMTTLKPRDEVEGSGMGLACVRKIAGLYNGQATVLSSPYGRGTMVEVRIGDQVKPA